MSNLCRLSRVSWRFGGSVLCSVCGCLFLPSEESQLKQRIKELSRYRKNGITKMDGQCVCVCKESERVSVCVREREGWKWHRLREIHVLSVTDCSEFDLLKEEEEKIRENKVTGSHI